MNGKGGESETVIEIGNETETAASGRKGKGHGHAMLIEIDKNGIDENTSANVTLKMIGTLATGTERGKVAVIVIESETVRAHEAETPKMIATMTMSETGTEREKRRTVESGSLTAGKGNGRLTADTTTQERDAGRLQ